VPLKSSRSLKSSRLSLNDSRLSLNDSRLSREEFPPAARAILNS
jgi:hypothetical protein